MKLLKLTVAGIVAATSLLALTIPTMASEQNTATIDDTPVPLYQRDGSMNLNQPLNVRVDEHSTLTLCNSDGVVSLPLRQWSTTQSTIFGRTRYTQHGEFKLGNSDDIVRTTATWVEDEPDAVTITSPIHMPLEPDTDGMFVQTSQHPDQLTLSNGETLPVTWHDGWGTATIATDQIITSSCWLNPKEFPDTTAPCAPPSPKLFDYTIRLASSPELDRGGVKSATIDGNPITVPPNLTGEVHAPTKDSSVLTLTYKDGTVRTISVATLQNTAEDWWGASDVSTTATFTDPASARFAHAVNLTVSHKATEGERISIIYPTTGTLSRTSNGAEAHISIDYTDAKPDHITLFNGTQAPLVWDGNTGTATLPFNAGIRTQFYQRDQNQANGHTAGIMSPSGTLITVTMREQAKPDTNNEKTSAGDKSHTVSKPSPSKPTSHPTMLASTGATTITLTIFTFIILLAAGVLTVTRSRV